jgi:hypothetical protein
LCPWQLRIPSSTSPWLSMSQTWRAWCGTYGLWASPRIESFSSLLPRFVSQPGRRSASYKVTESHLLHQTWTCWALVPPASNSDYSGGREQEDSGSDPTQAIVPQDPISKKTLHKNGLVEWLKV